MCLVSVIIPVKNGAATLTKCLTAIKQQTFAGKLEIIVLDSMSTDNSRNIAESFGAKVINVPAATFNHGLTRNTGVRESKGELIYFTVQDAYFSDNIQLEKMAAHFNDKEIASVTGMQGIPSDLDKNPAIWFKRYTVPNIEVRHFAGQTFSDLLPEQQLNYCRWDNVNAMYRRSALGILSFQKTDFAEDVLWARDALLRGWKIIRDPSLVVYHYHHESFRYVYRVNFMLNYTIWYYFKVMPHFPAVIKPIMQNTFTLLKRRQLPLNEKVKWILHNCVRHMAGLFSVVIFKLIYKIGNQKLLDRSYKYFCSIVPQGRQHKSGHQLKPALQTDINHIGQP